MSATAVHRADSQRSLEVVIIGAGFGGIAAAIELRRHGIADIRILEKAPDLGGTWYYNSYPGAACDVPSHLYSFSYAQRRDWAAPVPPQQDIHSYMHDVAREHARRADPDRHDRDRLHVGRGPLPLEHRDAESGNSYEADALILATGQLHQPHRPRAEGRGDVRGPQLPLLRMGPRLLLRGQARGGRRHRRERGAVHPRDRSPRSST